jgi:hypothetical protein
MKYSNLSLTPYFSMEPSHMKSSFIQMSRLLLSLLLCLQCFACTQGDSLSNSNPSTSTDQKVSADQSLQMDQSVVDMISSLEDMDPNADAMVDMDPNMSLNTPLIRRTRAYINRDEGGLGIEIIGRDEDNNVVGFFLEYFYDDGTALQLAQEPGPVGLKFNKLSQGNGDFIGTWSVPFITSSGLDLARLVRVEVSVLDDSKYQSETKSVELVNTPTSTQGEACDLNRGLSRCGEGLLCDLVAGGSKKCAPKEVECPMGYDVIDLNTNGMMYSGTTEGKPTYGVGACGGGTASNVFRFEAMQAGSYVFLATPTSSREDWVDDMGNPKAPDTLMWIRSHCRFSDWIAELGCSDDINVSLGDLRSEIRLEMTAGEVVFIFVDGYSDLGQPGWSGGFELSVTLGM